VHLINDCVFVPGLRRDRIYSILLTSADSE
jgi:hypothetical protein